MFFCFLCIRSFLKICTCLQINRVVQVGMGNHTGQSMDHCTETTIWQPILFSNHLSTNLSIILDIWMVDRRHELDFRKLEWIFGWELDIDSKKSTLKWWIFGALDGEFPMHDWAHLLDLIMTMLITILTLVHSRLRQTLSPISSSYKYNCNVFQLMDHSHGQQSSLSKNLLSSSALSYHNPDSVVVSQIS